MKKARSVSIILAVIMILGVFLPVPGLSPHSSAEAEEAGAYEHEFYVAPDGSDSNDGSIGQPFATLERARDAIRSLKSASALTGSVVVYLREGSYFRNASFTLEEQDSGLTPSQPIVYRAYGGENVRLMGGYELDTAQFQPVSNPSVSERLPETARGKVLQIDLRAQNITEYGELGQIGWGEQDLYKQGDDFLIAPELFINGQSLNLARWPNEGYVNTGQVLDPGTSAYNYWGKNPGDPGYVPPEERVYNGALFKYLDNRPDRWTQASDIWMFGYWVHDWADGTTRIKEIDRVNRTIKTDHALAFGVAQGKRYYYFNLLEEIDVPGEWYLDRDTGVLYLYPPAPIENSSVSLSVLQQPMIRMNGVSNVTFQGLSLEIMRGKTFLMIGGANNLIAGNTMRFIGEQAVYVNGGTNHGVVGNDIYASGTGGIRLGGGNQQTLTPAGHYAVNNTVQNFARNKKTYSPAISLGGVGNRAVHNLIHDAPHLAIMFGGNDHVIEFNEIYDVLLSTDDAGGIYSGRSWTTRGNVIRNNFFHDTGTGLGGHGNHTVYFDDGLGGVKLTHNVFYNVSDALFNHGGRDHRVENNLVIDSIDSFKMTAIHPDLLEGNLKTLKAGLNNVPYQSEPWSSKYPELVNILNDEPEKPKYNRIENNVYVNTPAEKVTDVVRDNGVIQNNLSLAAGADPGFADPQNYDFTLRPDSVIYEQLPQFQPIPFGQIGLVIDEYRTQLPQLGKFQLVSPSHGETGIKAGEVRFSWQPSEHADQYRLVVASDPGFTDIVKDQIVTGTSIVLSNLNFNEIHYWKVQAQSKSKHIRSFVWNEGGPASFLADGIVPVTDVQIHPGTDFVAVGSQLKLDSTITPPPAHSSQAIWSSSAPDIASVAQDGTVTGIRPGEAVISIVSNADPAIRDTVAITVFPPSNLLLDEKFDDGTADGWVESGGYAKVVTDSTGNGVYRLSRYENKDMFAYLPNSDWQDYTTEFTVRRNGHIWTNFGFRVKYDATNKSFYNFFYIPYENKWTLSKVANGTTKTLATYTMTMEQGKNYLIRAEANGSYIGLNIDGITVMEASDQTQPLTGGGLGLYVYNGDFQIDNLRVIVSLRETLSFEDFQDGIANGWTEPSGYAKVVQNSSGNYVYRINQYANKETLAQLSNSDWQNYTTEMKMKRNGHIWSNFGLRVKADQAHNNFYLFLYIPYENKWTLFRKTNGNLQALESYSMAMDQGEYYNLKAEVQGNRIGLWIDGTQVFAYADDQPLAGGGGLGLYVYNGDFEVDNIKVSALPADDAPPFTTAVTDGLAGGDFWFVTPATIRLEAADEASGVAGTEYKLTVVQAVYGNAVQVPEPVFQPYTGPITVTDGVYKVEYRSADNAGNVEDLKELTIKVDAAAPTFLLTNGDAELTEGAVFEEDQTLALRLAAEDSLSGVAIRRMLLDGQEVPDGSAIELAGKLGMHRASLFIADRAGNSVEAEIAFEVKTSIGALREIMEKFKESGELKGPLEDQLRTSLDQAEHHLSRGFVKQAAHHMDNFLKHLENPPMQEHVSDHAKGIMRTSAEFLIHQWQTESSEQ